MKKMLKNEKQQKVLTAIWVVILLICIALLIKNYGVEETIETLLDGTLPSGMTQEETSTSIPNTPTSTSQLGQAPVTMYFLDVGQADCILVKCDNEYALIDSGNIADGKEILEFLQTMEIPKLKYMFLSHMHEDHMGGAPTVITGFEIEHVIMPEDTATTSIYNKLLDALLKKDVDTIFPSPKDIFELGNGSFYILSCSSNENDKNDTSIVMKFTYNDFDTVFTGDATTKIEKEILDWYSFEDIEVLKLAHHGSRTSSSKAYLDNVNPESIVISLGRDNDYGHPHKEVINRLSKLDAKVYRTDELNTIVCYYDGEKFYFENYDICLDGDDAENVKIYKIGEGIVKHTLEALVKVGANVWRELMMQAES